MLLVFSQTEPVMTFFRAIVKKKSTRIDRLVEILKNTTPTCAPLCVGYSDIFHFEGD